MSNEDAEEYDAIMLSLAPADGWFYLPDGSLSVRVFTGRVVVVTDVGETMSVGAGRIIHAEGCRWTMIRALPVRAIVEVRVSLHARRVRLRKGSGDG